MSETILTMFDEQNPCWTSELLELAGEDTNVIDDLVSSGSLEFSEGIYSLTEAGKTESERLRNELFLEGSAGPKPSDPQRSVKRTKLRLLLDNAHLQRWGIKVYHAGKDLFFYPDINEDELLTLKNETLEWSYVDSQLYKKINEDFKPAFIEGRKTDLVTPERLSSWCEANSMEPGRLNIDLLYLCHYDFMQYRDFGGHPNDQIKVINTDRFLFVFPDKDIEKDLAAVAKFHLWLNTLRRMMIPGYVDRDTQEQDSVSWLIFTTDREDEAAAMAKELGKFGEKLIENANPCEIWTLSIEALENVTEKRELIWELLPDIAHPAQRTIIQAGGKLYFMFWDSALESIMLICFAAAWPASIHKSWTSKTRKGKSLFFLAIVFVGYAAGITRILLRADGSFLIFPYTFNALLVSCDLMIYYRNYRIDEEKPPLIPRASKDFVRDYFSNHRWRNRL